MIIICNDKNSYKAYIVMEYMNMGTLFEYRQKHKLTSKQTESLENKIKFMHDHGYLHIDLHEKNILVHKKDGKIDFYIADFGKAKSIYDFIEKFKTSNISTVYNFYDTINNGNIDALVNSIVVKKMLDNINISFL